MMPVDFDSIEWVPKAILDIPVDYFVRKFCLLFHQGQDDLDVYEGANLQLPDGRPYVLRHYRGYPADTVAIYLPFEVQDIDEISTSVRAIIANWNLSQNNIRWERRDGLPKFAT